MAYEGTAYMVCPAPSGRATCKKCHASIARNAIKFMSKSGRREKKHSEFNYHLRCASTRQVTKAVDRYGRLEDIPGVTDIQRELREQVLAALTHIRESSPEAMPLPDELKDLALAAPRAPPAKKAKTTSATSTTKKAKTPK